MTPSNAASSRAARQRLWDAQARTRSIEWVAQDAQRRFAADAADPRPLDDAGIAEWLRDIARDFTGYERHFRHNAVVDWVLRHNQATATPLRVPEKAVRIPLPRPPITERNFPDITRFRRVRAALAHALDADRDDGGAASTVNDDAVGRDRTIGFILLSAVAHGGVLDAKELSALARSAIRGIWRDDEFLVWIEWTSAEAGGCRRWLADPVSALLLLRWQQIHGGPLLAPDVPVHGTLDVLWAKLRHGLAALDLTPAERPRSLAQLLLWARRWYYVEIPPFLVAFASGTLPSASLPLRPWLRLLLCRPVELADGSAPPDEDRGIPPPARGDGDPMQAQLRRTLLGPAAKQPGYRSALANLDRFLAQDNVSPLRQALAHWCKHLLGATSAVAADRRANTVRVYLETIDARLARHFGPGDPRRHSVDERATAYDAMLAEAGTELTRARIARALHLFERFLDPGSALADELIKGIDDTRQTPNVDANFFSTGLLREVRTAIGPGRQRHDAADATLREVALVLGVHGKLRRVEAWRLRLGDLNLRAQPELLVRPHRGEKLKSASGTRRAPLHATCTDDELRILRECARTRSEGVRAAGTGSEDDRSDAQPAAANGEALLFVRDGRGQAPIPEATLFDPITAALQAVGADPTARFHHLRHSGLNRDHLLLASAALPGCTRLLGEDATTVATAAATLQRALTGRAAPARIGLWAIASAAGHASPETTCRSYLHFNDWLLYCAVSATAPALNARAVAALFGISAAALRKAKERLGESDRWPDLIARYDPELAAAVAPSFTVVERSVPLPAPAASTPTTAAPAAPAAFSAALVIDALVAAARPSPELEARVGAHGDAGAALLMESRQYPPLPGAMAEAMAGRLPGLAASARAALAAALADPMRWVAAAQSVGHAVPADQGGHLYDNARTLNRLRGTSTNRTWQEALARKGFPLFVRATSAGLTLTRPLPYPMTRIGHTAERRAIDEFFAAIVAVVAADETDADAAIGLLLERHDRDAHHWSFAEPAEVVTLMPFVQAVLEFARAAGGWECPQLASEHLPHVPTTREVRRASSAPTPDAQRAVWASALGIDPANLPPAAGRPLGRRAPAHGLLRLALPFAGSARDAHPNSRVKRHSAALYHAAYVYCLTRQWSFT